MKTLAIDFEFKNSRQHNPLIVCCSTILQDGETILESNNWWLYNQPEEVHNTFKEYIQTQIENGVVFLAHYATAEVRCLLNYFEDKYLLKYLKVLDSYVLWKQIEKDPNIAFGIRYEKGVRIVSEIPWKTSEYGEKTVDTTKEFGTYNEETDTYNEDTTFVRTAKSKMSRAGLVSIVANRLDVDLDSEHKEKMRDLIIYSDTFTDEEAESIMKYCESDIKYLKPLINKLFEDFNGHTNPNEQIDVCQWMITSAIIERNGFPVDVEKFKMFAKNADMIKNQAIETCNKIFPFFELNEKTGKYVKKYDNFVRFIEETHIDGWAKTEKGNYKMDRSTLKKYTAYDEIDTLYHCISLLSELRMLNNDKKLNKKTGRMESSVDRILDNIGDDNRCRVMTSPFATITSRNAPSVRNGWFLAMSTWLRSFVDHPNLWGCDYASQEIWVMAKIANDKNLLKAYEDGDPYSWFAASSNLVPPGSNVKKEYPEIRQLCKALLLGIGYGMGNVALAGHLTASRLGSLKPEEKEVLLKAKKDAKYRDEADQIIDTTTIYGDETLIGIPKKNKATYYKGLYDNVFTEVKKYGYKIRDQYKQKGFLKLKDGWTIQHFDRATTTSNFEIQGNSSVILKEAARLAIMNDIEVVATLHDALYIIANKPEDTDKLQRCMDKAVENVMDCRGIRSDLDQYYTDWDTLTSPWTKSRGSDMLTNFGKYFLEDFTKKDNDEDFWS